MDYLRIYEEIIIARIDNTPDGYTENHHILPKAFGGTRKKSNMVRLTAREHFIAHICLAKVFGGPMHSAVWAMTHEKGTSGKGVKITSRIFETLRKNFAEQSRLNMLGTNYAKGYKFTDEQREARSKQRTGVKHTENTCLIFSASKRASEVLYKSNVSGVKGVFWCETHNKWVAQITVSRKRMTLGRYELKNDAIIARWTEELKHEFAIIIY